MPRFSLLYPQGGEAALDSPKLRRRVVAFMREFFDDAPMGRISAIFATELGADLNTHSHKTRIFAFIIGCDVETFLDCIFETHQSLRASGYTQLAQLWQRFAARAFDEENSAYQIDATCQVVLRVDPIFEAAHRSAIHSLGRGEFAGVLEATVHAFEYLQSATPDNLAAVRNIFEAAESLFGIVAQTRSPLDEATAQSNLQPNIQRHYAASGVAACQAATRLLQGFAKWVSAAHPYRHGHPGDERTQPPQELAIELVGQGASFIRWMATIHPSGPE